MQIICVSGSALLVRIQFAYFFTAHAQDGGIYPVFHYQMHGPVCDMLQEIERRMDQENGKGYFLAIAGSEDHTETIRQHWKLGVKSVFILDARSNPERFVRLADWDVIVPPNGRIEDHARTLAEGVALL